MMDIRVRLFSSRFAFGALVLSAVLFAVVACDNPASANGDGDPQD